MVLDLNQHVLDLLPAFVLDALTDEETYQVARHLEVCPSCQGELAHLQQIADDLPLALKQREPPARLKTNLMKSIEARHSQGLPTKQPGAGKTTATFLRYLPVFGLAVVLILGVVNILLWRQLSTVNRQPGTQFQVVALANTQNSPAAIGELVLDPNGQYGTLVVDNLAALASTQQYQVWLTRDGERTSGGVFSVNPDGYAALEISAPQPLNTYDSISISLEPYGGSPAPTGDRVLVGDIPR